MQEKRENNVRLISPCLKAGVLRRDPIKFLLLNPFFCQEPVYPSHYWRLVHFNPSNFG